MTAPPAAVAERLADDLHAISVHEAAHAVIGILLGLPVARVWLAWRKPWLSDWHVQGRSELSRRVDEHPDVAAVVAAVGPAAEIRCRVARGVRPSAARRQVHRARCNRGDFREVAAALRDRESELDAAGLDVEVEGLLDLNWDAVTAVAAALRDHGRLERRDLDRLTR
ncbi:hypothetical protein GCM10022243_48670 [Saccharothrix violaceirubra]|uniref:Peptidase M41-like protein n=1 Tax=Saccharothrix violaceirubra TaxID=413306 RepID=A0A7W7SZZ4_9PSEU|nr:hypothetical protein [Saccharothrix violaceirubra]MBB4963791.1 hypothetical protein [Saccharothrix violaceirubra]